MLASTNLESLLSIIAECKLNDSESLFRSGMFGVDDEAPLDGAEVGEDFLQRFVGSVESDVADLEGRDLRLSDV